MARRFIVALDTSTKQQNDAFIEFVKEKGLPWWHWLSNFWLLVDPHGDLTAAELRDVLDKSHPGVNNLVIVLREDGDSWAGLGPKGEERNMFTWLRNTWGKYKKKTK